MANYTKTQDDAEKSRKLIDMVKSFDTVMFITINYEGNISMRPMKVVKTSNQGDLWFASPRTSEKVDEAIDSNIVYITAQSSSTFVSLKGKPKVYQDQTTKDELWSEPMRVWFPEGTKDPNLCFIKVTIEEGEWWDNSGLEKVFYLVESVKSYLTGTRPHIDSDIHGKASLN